MIHALEIKIDVIMQILLILGILIMVGLSLKHVKIRVCHDQVSLSQVMNLYYFIYDFVFFSLIDDYDNVLVGRLLLVYHFQPSLFSLSPLFYSHKSSLEIIPNHQKHHHNHQ